MANASQHISQDLKQSLKLSPVQIRFGKILEMSTPEFEEEVERALEENPALEVADDVSNEESLDFPESATELQRADFASDEDTPQYLLHQPLLDRDYQNFDITTVESGAPDQSILEIQLADMNLSDFQLLLCKYVLGNLDSNGYLTRSAEAMADDVILSEGIDVTPAQMAEAVEIVQTLDPAGIGATDLRDCLRLQLARMSEREGLHLARVIVEDYFNYIALNNVEKIAGLTDTDVNEVNQAIDLIKSLNPKPGSVLETTGGNDRLRHITPDFIIDCDNHGKIQVQLTGRYPELRIEASFNINSADSAARDFIRERRDSATQFISLAKRRADTLMTVMTTIIALQPEYFKSYDRSDLRPMVLRDVADRAGIDVSTVSRAVSMKYALTPFGTVSLKSLFSESVNRDGDLSAHKVETALVALIESEDKTAPLTDSALVDALAAQGIKVARRTVTKYREAAGIPSTHYRKQKS